MKVLLPLLASWGCEDQDSGLVEVFRLGKVLRQMFCFRLYFNLCQLLPKFFQPDAPVQCLKLTCALFLSFYCSFIVFVYFLLSSFNNLFSVYCFTCLASVHLEGRRLHDLLDCLPLVTAQFYGNPQDLGILHYTEREVSPGQPPSTLDLL